MKGVEEQQVTAKFGNEGDKIMGGKPCANCNCGRKEEYEKLDAD